MAIQHYSKVFGFQDAKIYPLTSDPAGGSATYGTGIDVPGVKTLEISGDIEAKELRGDNSLLDVFSTLRNVKGKLTHAKLSLDVLAVQLGGSVVDAGSGSTETATWELTSASAPKYWKIEGKCPTDGVDLIGGDLHITFWKAILASFPGIGYAEEDYQIPGWDFTTVPLLATGNRWMTVVLNETATVIS